MGALVIFNNYIIPSLLFNCDVWVGISSQSVKRLDDLQHMFVRLLLRLPSSTPIPALRGALGLMGMKWRIWVMKLNLVLTLKNLSKNALARKVFYDQITQGYLGLVKEMVNICKEIGLKNICIEDVSKNDIKIAVRLHHLKCLKEEMKDLEKCSDLLKQDLSKPQSYFTSKSMEESRVSFRVQVRMIDCPGNMKGKYIGRMGCTACLPWREAKGEEEVTATQDHLTKCPAYSFIRENYDMSSFSDITKYFMKLMATKSVNTP